MTEDTLRKLKQAEVRIHPHTFKYGFELGIYNPEMEIVVSDFTFKEVDPNQRVASLPTITDSMAQQLMDQLWNAGLRPSNQLESIGQKESMQNHIDDLRKIIFNKFEIE